MRNFKPKRAAVFGAMAVVWIGVLFFFSGQSGEASGDLSGQLTQFLFGWLIDRGADAAMLEHILRKTAHFSIFAVEGFLLGMTFLNLLRRKTALPAALVTGALLAVGNELHQLTAVERSCNVTDMLIDTSGAATGLLAAYVLLHLLGTWHNTNQERITTGDLT